jgi:hypothetical protein
MTTRTVTLREYADEVMRDLLADLNRRAQARGEDVQLVFDRPRPRLVAERDEVVVPLRANQRRNGNGNEAI